MTNEIKVLIDSRHKKISELLVRTENRMKSFPDGRLKIRHIGKNTYYYYVGEESKERLLNKTNGSLITELLQKDYLQKVIKSITEELKTLDKMKSMCVDLVAEDVYDNLSEDRKYSVKPIIPTDEQLVSRWLAEPYTPKPISEDVPIFETKKGERVRSKSEMIIANMLYDNGIPYKYECPLFVGGEKIHPDFTILRLSDRKIIYYEHCGRMGDPGYVEDMVERSRKYTLAGICQGDSLFYTFESAKFPLDVRVVSEMIEKNFR